MFVFVACVDVRRTEQKKTNNDVVKHVSQSRKTDPQVGHANYFKHIFPMTIW